MNAFAVIICVEGLEYNRTHQFILTLCIIWIVFLT